MGARAELAVAGALVDAGYAVYLPLFAADSRVDLVVERNGALHRVQCKTSRLENGCILFRACSNTRNAPKDYRGEVDFFGVWSPELKQAFLVPVADAPTRECTLRVEPARSSQLAGIRYAAPYLIG